MRIVLFCIMAGRTKHIHGQRSFRFLAERHKTLANETLAKRAVTKPTPLLPRATPLSRFSCSTPTSFPGFSPTRSYGARGDR